MTRKHCRRVERCIAAILHISKKSHNQFISSEHRVSWAKTPLTSKGQLRQGLASHCWPPGRGVRSMRRRTIFDRQMCSLRLRTRLAVRASDRAIRS